MKSMFILMLTSGLICILVGLFLFIFWHVPNLRSELSGRSSRMRVKRLQKVSMSSDTGLSTSDLYSQDWTRGIDVNLDNMGVEKVTDDRPSRSAKARVSPAPVIEPVVIEEKPVVVAQEVVDTSVPELDEALESVDTESPTGVFEEDEEPVAAQEPDDVFERVWRVSVSRELASLSL